MHSTAHKQLSFFGPFLENKVPTVPTVCQWPPTFFFQETHFVNFETHTRPTYDVSSEGCSQRHQGQGAQKVLPSRTSSYSLRAGKGSYPRNGFHPKKWPESQDYHRGTRGASHPHLAHWNAQGFPHALEYSPQHNQETGHLQGLQGSMQGLCRAVQSGEASEGHSGSSSKHR